MSDLWAYCDPCGRWFYPEFREGTARSTAPCPVCSTQPLTFSDATQPATSV